MIYRDRRCRTTTVVLNRRCTPYITRRLVAPCPVLKREGIACDDPSGCTSNMKTRKKLQRIVFETGPQTLSNGIYLGRHSASHAEEPALQTLLPSSLRSGFRSSGLVIDYLSDLWNMNYKHSDVSKVNCLNIARIGETLGRMKYMH